MGIWNGDRSRIDEREEMLAHIRLEADRLIEEEGLTEPEAMKRARARFGYQDQIDPKDSWMVAAAEHDLPLFVPGWEDSTLGNIFAAHLIEGTLASPSIVMSGPEYMVELARWYEEITADGGLGFFQIGGGIAAQWFGSVFLGRHGRHPFLIDIVDGAEISLRLPAKKISPTRANAAEAPHWR